MNNEKKEKILISLILESSKQSAKLAEKYLPKTKKLFESVFYSEEVIPTISLNECRNNKLFYLDESSLQLQILLLHLHKVPFHLR